MGDFLFSLNAVLPIVIMVAAGYAVKRLGFLNEAAAGAINKLVFRLLLPCSLFLNVYGIEDIASVDLKYMIFAAIATVLIFLFAIPATKLATKENTQRSALVQGMYRSNYALIGIPLATSLFGEEGAVIATLLSAFIIPLYNVLAVIGFSALSDRKEKPSFKKMAVGVVKNPLIVSIFLGFVCLGLRAIFRRCDVSFRLSDLTPVYAVINQLSKTTTPMALLALGAQFEFSVVSGMKKQIIFGTVMRTVVVPAVFLSVAYVMDCFNGAHFAAFVALFATPTAVASVPMAQEFQADTRLAGQLVVWTTLVSTLSIFLFCFALKAMGIFG